jgi:hypothetical protein
VDFPLFLFSHSVFFFLKKMIKFSYEVLEVSNLLPKNKYQESIH